MNKDDWTEQQENEYQEWLSQQLDTDRGR